MTSPREAGWRMTSLAGGNAGEIGGFIWRDEKPAYYARQVGPLRLEDELFASGRITFLGAGSDGGVYLKGLASRILDVYLGAEYRYAPAAMMNAWKGQTVMNQLRVGTQANHPPNPAP